MKTENNTVDSFVDRDYGIKNDIVAKNKKKILAVAGICLTAIIIIVLIISTAVSSSSTEMKKALESRDAYQVNAVYNDAYGKPSKIEKYDVLIGELLDEIYDNLETHDFYEEAKVDGYTTPRNYMYSTYGNLIINEVEDGTNIYNSVSQRNISKWNDIHSLISCLEHYCAAICYYENYNIYENAYQNAISELSEALQNDCYKEKTLEHMEKCTSKYFDNEYSEAEKLIQDKEFSQAINKLSSVLDYFEKNNVNTENFQKKYDELLDSYAKEYYNKAEESFSKRDMNNAIENIEISIQLRSDNKKYVDKKAYYEEFLPFHMYYKDNTKSFDDADEYTYTWRTIDFYPEEAIEAVDGNLYSGCINYRYYSGAKEGTVKYVLDKKYDTISGVFFSPKANVSMNRTGSAYFVVYGDGKEIYKSKTISANSTPIDFSFSVTGVKNLEINFVGENSSVWGADAYSFGDYATIAELTAQKNFPEK